MRYVVIIEETGYSAYVPYLLGCVSVGGNRYEIENNIQEAIIFHLDGMKEDGEKIPPLSVEAVTMLISNVA